MAEKDIFDEYILPPSRKRRNFSHVPYVFLPPNFHPVREELSPDTIAALDEKVQQLRRARAVGGLALGLTDAPRQEGLDVNPESLPVVVVDKQEPPHEA